jgi:CheY-like chemotaxis protein
MRALGSRDLSCWFADGSNYPGSASIRDRKRWFEEELSRLHEALEGNERLLVEYKPFEPAFYHTDIGMPGMDGYEACRRLRQQPSAQHMVVVAVTGWGRPQDKQRALDAGFDAHLTKPVDPSALASVLGSRGPSGPPGTGRR